MHVWEEPKNPLESYTNQIIRSLRFVSVEKPWMYQSRKIDNSSVIRQNSEFQNGGNKKAKHAKFLTPCAYQGVRNVRFSEIFKNNYFENICEPLLPQIFLEVFNFIKKRLQHSCFPRNIVNFLRPAFVIEHFRWLLPDLLMIKAFFSS